MTASTTTELVRAIAAEVAARSGLVVEEVTITPAGKRRLLRVVVDLPEEAVGAVSLDAVAAASQELSAALDAREAMGAAPYVLEVTSPGVDRPLTERRHFLRARGRLVQVQLVDGQTAAGRLLGAGAEGIELDGDRRLPWDQVRRGRVEVEFNPPAADPVDALAEGA